MQNSALMPPSACCTCCALATFHADCKPKVFAPKTKWRKSQTVTHAEGGPLWISALRPLQKKEVTDKGWPRHGLLTAAGGK